LQGDKIMKMKYCPHCGERLPEMEKHEESYDIIIGDRRIKVMALDDYPEIKQCEPMGSSMRYVPPILDIKIGRGYKVNEREDAGEITNNADEFFCVISRRLNLSHA
jgi:hypothetical protein